MNLEFARGYRNDRPFSQCQSCKSKSKKLRPPLPDPTFYPFIAVLVFGLFLKKNSFLKKKWIFVSWRQFGIKHLILSMVTERWRKKDFFKSIFRFIAAKGEIGTICWILVWRKEQFFFNNFIYFLLPTFLNYSKKYNISWNTLSLNQEQSR